MDDLIRKTTLEMMTGGRLWQESNFFQHGKTTVLEHSLHVAEMSLSITRRLHISVDESSMIRGALLHDYFLYDWHDRTSAPRLHGFHHPKIALNNANQDFELNRIEKNIILRHMFPLTPVPPLYFEAWIVCFADKCCAVEETLSSRICFVNGGTE